MLLPPEAAAQLNSSSFSPATWYASGAISTHAVAVGDLNNDGFRDLVVSTQCYSTCPGSHTGVFVYLNKGDGTFLPPAGYQTDGYGSDVFQSVAIADMDGDGNPDLVVLNASYSLSTSDISVSVMRGNGNGTFQAAVSYPLNIYPTADLRPGQLTVADVNGDGRPDVLVSDSVYNGLTHRGAVSVLVNHGDGTLASPVLYDSGGYMGAQDLIAADVNRDGFPDILVGNVCSTTPTCSVSSGPFTEPSTIGVLLGNGDGTFQQAVSYPSGGRVPGNGFFFVPLAAVDLNRDGNLDVLVANGANSQGGVSHAATVLIGNGDGSFRAPVDYDDGAVQPSWIAAGDVDGDGLADAVVLNNCSAVSCTGILSVLLSNGDGTFQVPALYDLVPAVGPNTIVVDDLNNDGKPDIVVATWNSVGVLLNQTSRAATTTTLLSQPNPSGFGQSVTFSATVSSSSPGSPTGTVTFMEGSTILGTAPPVAGIATLNLSSLSLGNHSVIARYSSDSSFRASVSAPLTQVVKGGTSTTLGSSTNPSLYLQSVTLTATVTAQSGGALSGSVTFKVGATVLATIALSGNTAGFSTSSLAIGTHSITAEYSGDAANLGSTSAALNQMVAALTQVTVDTSLPGLMIVVDSVAYSAPRTFSWTPGSAHTIATVSPQAGPAGTQYVFTNWSDGGALSHSVTAPGSAATYTANFTTQYLLTTSVNPSAGGSITSGGWFDSGSSVTITATPASGYSFSGFSGDLSGATNPASLTMSSAKTVTANFLPVSTGQVNPQPFISQPLEPTAVTPAGSGLTLTVRGAGFVPGSVVRWNGSALATTFVNRDQLTATVPPADVVSNGTAAITVVNPAPGGGVSNVAYFETTNPTASLTFATTNYAFPSQPQSIVVGDFNGDGKPDFALATVFSVSVLLNNGDGTFQAPADYLPGSSLAVGDFNGDGKLDLAVGGAGVNASSVAVLLGIGDGTFQTPVKYPAGNFSNSVRVADFNGDGTADLVVTHQTDNTVSVLLGNGDGTFQAPVNSPAGVNGHFELAIGDFNGDGKLDLAMADNAGSPDNTVTVVLGNGDGTFQPAMEYAVGTHPISVAVADLNGDGKLDLAVANDSSNNVSVLLGNGNGTFQPAVNYAAGTGPASVAVADLNGDGRPDLAVADVGGNSVSVLLGNGDGTFQAATNYTEGTNPYWVAVGDFNGDGRLDLAVAELSSRTASIMLQSPLASLSANSLSFSNQLLGTASAAQSVSISNAGSAPLNVANIAVTGADPADFSVTNTCGTSVPAGGSCSLGVTFNPAGTGPRIATLTVTDNNNTTAGSTQTVSLTGTGLAALVITASSATVAYGGAAPAITASYTGFVNGDTAASLAAVPACTTTATSSSPVGTYPTTCSGAVDLNYTISYTPGTVTITAAPLTITASSGAMVYGGPVPAITASFSGFVNGEKPSVLTTQPVCSTTATSTSPAGSSFPSVCAGAAAANYTIAYVPGSVAVSKAASAATITSHLPAPSVTQQSVTVAIAVAPQFTGTPTGSVTVTASSGQSCTAALAAGAGSCQLTFTLVGTPTLTAAYSGDVNFLASASPVVSHTVRVAATTTALISSANPAAVGQSVTFTATVSGQYGGVPTGSVIFLSGSTTLGSAPLSSSAASFSTTFAGAGTFSITAAYSGDGNFSPSTSPALSQTVTSGTRTTTTTRLTTGAIVSFVGQAVTLTARVNSTAGAPPNGETVTFRDGTTPIGTGAISAGVATFTTASLTVGAHTITAVYAGDAVFAGSTSNTIPQAVSKYLPKAALVSSLNPSLRGHSVTFTATVTSTGSNAPSGTVTFRSGLSTLGTVTLSGGKAVYTTATLPLGTDYITVTYNGDSYNLPSISPVVQQKVN